MNYELRVKVWSVVLAVAAIGLPLLLAYGIEANHVFTPFFEGLNQ